MTLLSEVLSPQQYIIYHLHTHEEKKLKDIAQKLNCSINTIKTQWKRIKKKIVELEHCNDISEIFYEEEHRQLPQITTGQAQFFNQRENMSCRQHSQQKLIRQKAKETEEKQSTTDPIDPIFYKWKASLEKNKETINPVNNRRRDPLLEVKNNPRIAGIEKRYWEMFDNTNNPEKMAGMEIELRAHGLIYRTPYINKLNRKTSVALRAKEEGFEVVLIEPDDKDLIPQGAKYLETCKNNKGKAEYSVWLFPKAM